jgi:nucleoside-diphosphate-sugar epimerase
MKVLVIGGTAFIGRLLVAELLKAGHDVTVLHRKSRHMLGRRVQNLQCDRGDTEAVREAIWRRGFEIVFDNAYDWERGTTAAHVEAAAHACGDRLERYVFMSSVGAYGDGLNHHESDPLAGDDHSEPYIRNKAMTERMLFWLHHKTKFPVVTLRPPFVYGPENPFYREAFFWDRMKAGRPILLPGDGLRLMQFVYVKDLVAAMLAAISKPVAAGEAFNIANEKPLTQAELVQALAAAARKKPQIARVPRDRIVEAGGNPMGQPAYFGFYFDLPAITEVVNKAKRMLGFQPTPFDQGLRETHRWYLRHHKTSRQDYLFEDKLIALAQPAG